MQGLELPTPNICSSSSLPPSATRPLLPPPLPPLSHQHIFVEPAEDTSGRALIMRRTRPTLTTSTPSASSVRTTDAPSVSSTPPPAVREEEIHTSVTPVVMEEIVVHDILTSTSEQISRTQKWRLLKSNPGEYGQGVPAPKRSRKIYHCGECGQVRSKFKFYIYINVYMFII